MEYLAYMGQRRSTTYRTGDMVANYNLYSSQNQSTSINTVTENMTTPLDLYQLAKSVH